MSLDAFDAFEFEKCSPRVEKYMNLLMDYKRE
jgi:hypothetical protein